MHCLILCLAPPLQARSILTGLFSVDVLRGRGDKMGTIFTMLAPKNLRRQKIVQNFSKFLTNIDFDGEYLRKKSEHLQPLPRWTKKVGVLRYKNENVIDSNKFTP